jgi:glycosidase
MPATPAPPAQMSALPAQPPSAANDAPSAPPRDQGPRPAYRDAVVYQIYWRAFGDPTQGAQSIVERLPYLKHLGVTDLWITPMYPSPQKDWGYDISNYFAVDKNFGTEAQFDHLVTQARAHGMRIMVDMVLNHVSDQHSWFLDVKHHGRRSAWYRYFIWGDATSSGGPPDQRRSVWDAAPGSAWRWVPEVGQYVLHTFTEQQIDVDWTNPAVRRSMADIVVHWGKRGVGGFRFDVIDLIDKQPGKPQLRGWLAELYDRALSQKDFVTVGEMMEVTPESLGQYTQAGQRGLNMVFNFQFPLLTADATTGNKFLVRHPAPEEIKHYFERWQTAATNQGGHNAVYVGNHDWARVVSRFGASVKDGTLTDDVRQAVARLYALLLLTHRGTPFIYQGDELGLANTVHDSLDAYQDPESLNYHRDRLQEPGITHDMALGEVQRGSRDAARSPLPWAATGPFSVDEQQKSPTSVLRFYQELIALRQQTSALVDGGYRRHDHAGDGPYIFSRQLPDGQQIVIVANLNDTAQPLAWPHDLADLKIYTELLTTHAAAAQCHTSTLTLQPYEARIYSGPIGPNQPE